MGSRRPPTAKKTSKTSTKACKRLIVTGLPCPPEPWEKLLGADAPHRVLPLVEILENVESNELREMAKYVAGVIQEYQPSSIVCHDFGVPLTLLALLRLQKKGEKLSASVTVFNGAFRKLDVFKTPHFFRAQVMSYRSATKEVLAAGGTVDKRLRPYLGRIRALYRGMIVYSLAEKLENALGLKLVPGRVGELSLKAPIQIIASHNDPYIPRESVEQLARDFAAKRVVHLNYGHFPYSISSKKVLPLVQEFEKNPTGLI